MPVPDPRGKVMKRSTAGDWRSREAKIGHKNPFATVKWWWRDDDGVMMVNCPTNFNQTSQARIRLYSKCLLCHNSDAKVSIDFLVKRLKLILLRLPHPQRT